MPSKTTSTAIPSRRNPVPIERASTSKSSTTNTRIPQRCQAPGVNAVSAGDTVLTPTESYNDAMTDAAIEMTSVCKRYGETVALDGMSFSVQPGRVTGFIGPNGAGKSTAMRVILGLDAPDDGMALVGGRPYRTLHRPLTQVGALLDADALQPSRSGRNHLLWMAHSQRIGAGRVDEVIHMVGLTGAAKRKAGGYSLGMRQRLGIAAAMLGDPPIVMMDEPFNGIDPEGIIWMRGFLRALAADGRAILISSHLMSELEDVVDHVVVVARGRVIADATIEELLAKASQDIVTVRTDAPANAVAVIQGAGGTASVTSTDRVEVAGLPPRRLVEILSAGQVPFSEVTSQRANLEDVYLQLTAGEAEFQAHSGLREQR